MSVSIRPVNKKVSVIIPCYNNSDTISKAIDSVIAQDYSPVEIILINDGSVDKTEETILVYINGKTKVGITYIYVSIENSGPSFARNIGLDIAGGEYVAFLDADDEWFPNKLNRQLEFFNDRPELAMVAGAFEVLRIADSNVVYRDISLRQLLFKNYFFTPVVLGKTSVFRKYKFNEMQRYSEDYLLWLKICSNHPTIYINQIMAKNQRGKASFGESGLSSNLWLMQKGELSNFRHLYDNRIISLQYYFLASCYSLVRYFRRVIISVKK